MTTFTYYFGLFYWVVSAVRCWFALGWTMEMASYARKGVDKGNFDIRWFEEWNAILAIFSPLHWDKWTSAQWIKYQKEHVCD